MKPVNQTKLHNPPESIGNCLEAVYASLLECSIDDIPIYHQSDYFEKYQRFFFEKKNWLLVDVSVRLGLVPNKSAGYHEMYGKSPRGDCYHAVVAFEGIMVHDPHPDKTGLKTVEGYIIFIPIGMGISPYLKKQPPTKE